jgi:hypothetical protein
MLFFSSPVDASAATEFAAGLIDQLYIEVGEKDGMALALKAKGAEYYSC